MHRLADEVFAQHGPERRAAIAIAREGCASRALELDVTSHAVAPHPFTQQDGATITELRHEATELMTGVRLGDGVGVVRRLITREQSRAFSFERARIEAEFFGQTRVEHDQPRIAGWRRRDSRVEPRWQGGISVLKSELHDGQQCIPRSATSAPAIDYGESRNGGSIKVDSRSRAGGAAPARAPGRAGCRSDRARRSRSRRTVIKPARRSAQPGAAG